MEQQLYYVLGFGMPVAAAAFAFFLINRINASRAGRPSGCSASPR